MSDYKKDNIWLMKGDCLDRMKEIPDGSIDAVICDPPYGTTQNKWDSIIPLSDMWTELNRVIKINGAIVMTSAQPFTAALIMSNPKMFRYDLIWEKPKSTGFLNANRMPLRSHEHILIFYRKLPTYNPQKTVGHKPTNTYTKHTTDGGCYGKTKQGISGGGNTDRHPRSVQVFSSNTQKSSLHPTQKPVELIEWLIKTYTNEGETVLDFAIGSGTSAIACQNLNRKCIGIELDEENFDISKNRILNNKPKNDSE